MSKRFNVIIVLVAATALTWGKTATADVRYEGYPTLHEYSFSDGSIPEHSVLTRVYFRVRNRRLEARLGQSPWFKTRTANGGRSVRGVSSVFSGPNGCNFQNSLASDAPSRSRIFGCFKSFVACPSAYGYVIYCGNVRAR
jgi:hypothetical protein